jgi:hypothetical protein
MHVPLNDPNDLSRQHLDSLLIELLGRPIENDPIGELWESQSPTQTNLNYAQALRIVNQANQVKNQEKK